MSTPLADYMQQERITDAAMASAIGKDRSLVNRLRNGSVRPTIEVAAAIERETGGQVPMQAWVRASQQVAA
ncbi:helix-turn-helix domain-containing protein [Sphingomonas sp. NY01]|uniref:helix-turn-helix transcriptional regulator n=1 Tax=Sphingomonas sp. NY01 TaxID=2968057 RepID=UPI00315D25B6